MLYTAPGPVTSIALVAYTVLSAVSFVLYGLDKRAAVSRTRRTSEVTLHLLSLAGGWPGGLLGQFVFRHKTRKRPFLALFWCTVFANALVVGWIFVGKVLPG